MPLHCCAGVSEQKVNQSFSAQSLMHGLQIDSKQTAKAATLSAALKEVFDTAAAPTPAPEEAVSAIPAGVPKITAVPTHVPGAGVMPTPSLLAVQVHGSSNPKQTLAEMAAWLDAQLAAAPGKSLVKATPRHRNAVDDCCCTAVCTTCQNVLKGLCSACRHALQGGLTVFSSHKVATVMLPKHLMT